MIDPFYSREDNSDSLRRNGWCIGNTVIAALHRRQMFLPLFFPSVLFVGLHYSPILFFSPFPFYYIVPSLMLFYSLVLSAIFFFFLYSRFSSLALFSHFPAHCSPGILPFSLQFRHFQLLFYVALYRIHWLYWETFCWLSFWPLNLFFFFKPS